MTRLKLIISALLLVATAGCAGDKEFDELDREFTAIAYTLRHKTCEIIDRYESDSIARRVNDACLRDGTFDEMDWIVGRQKELLEQMTAHCPQGKNGLLIRRIEQHINLCWLVDIAEYPYISIPIRCRWRR